MSEGSDEVAMQRRKTPPDGHAEVRVVAASPEVARRVAESLRHCFAAAEQRGDPAGADGGTRLDLTRGTTRAAEPVRSWLETSRSAEDDTVTREPESGNGPPGPFGE
ncbi:hypothetical protein [Streptomyces sp. TRM68416]|uniref:hypothetical protein n=1 Tax=Streptomyces sp. TRM68416 TaxID=2758412 RepID=UPI00397F3D88